MGSFFKIFANRPIRLIYFLSVCVVLIVIVGVSIVYFTVRLSLYDSETEGKVVGLTAPVTVTRDQFNVPEIVAESRMDAYRSLGYVTARDRLFQMDLLRRKSAGKFAEIFGEAAVSYDQQQRIYGFEDVVKKIIIRLPTNQVEILQAYADGVNSAIDSMAVVPFEFLLLGYHPDHWRVEDSLLIVLDMFQTLNDTEGFERMLSVMAHALPPEVYRFLTPKTDTYTQSVLEETQPIDSNVPVEALVSLLSADFPENYADFVQASHMQPGSNAWAVSGAKTMDGRAILANDMHLPISVPNIWYQCQLQFGEQNIAGVSLPGTPLIVSGATRHLAWGATSLSADVLDLVKIEVNPDNPKEYRTPDGWKPFGVKRESINVKGTRPEEIEIKTTIWGPVAMRPLLGHPVAIHWTALDPDAISLDLLNIDQVETLEQGLALINETGGPPLNMILADHTGRVGWTIMGRIPVRNKYKGFNGSTSYSWANGSVSWSGYITPEELPRRTDADGHQGFVVNANNRSIDKDYPYTIAHTYASGYRAYRIKERLNSMDNVSEKDMLQLQLDTVSGVYDFYRDIALAALTPDRLAEQPNRHTLREHLLAWDGKADTDGLGLGLIVQFRADLAKALFEPILQSSRKLDAEFKYIWAYLDVPLQALIDSNDSRLLPDQKSYPDWDSFLLAQLEKSAQVLIQQHAVESLDDLTWGDINVAKYTHPLSQGIPGIDRLLDFPRDPLPGCFFCVRVDSSDGAASMRLVVSPTYLEDGILHMPGGQSGHPFSKHYMDQHPYWIKGLPIRFMSGESQHKLRLVPIS